MMASKRVLLSTPTIISHRHARFPLAVMSLSVALEGKYDSAIVDGNGAANYVSTALRAIDDGSVAAVGVTVMGGPQLRSAIALSKAIREKAPAIPIVWGGAFPTVCPDAALNAAYVDYVVRAQGEETLVELLQALAERGNHALESIAGLSWRLGGANMHNKDRRFSAASLNQMLPYEKLDNPRQYLTKTYLGRRTIGYQAALGCRFRCTFCGVVKMFQGRNAL